MTETISRSRYYPEVDLDRLDKMIELLKDPKTIRELSKSLKVSDKTVYRDFDRIQERDYKIIRLGTSRPTLYMIWKRPEDFDA
jgi:predicted DNA-binding transcriptional regulator YafY